MPSDSGPTAVSKATAAATGGTRAPLYTCRGRAVGLLTDWLGGYVKTVSGYGKRVQRGQPVNRPRPMRVAARSRRDFVAHLAKD